MQIDSCGPHPTDPVSVASCGQDCRVYNPCSRGRWMPTAQTREGIVMLRRFGKILGEVAWGPSTFRTTFTARAKVAARPARGRSDQDGS